MGIEKAKFGAVEEGDLDGFPVVDCGDGWHVQTVRMRASDIADCDVDSETLAHLFAAAPDMLEALEDAEEWLMDDRYSLPDDVVDAMRAAIAKAKGTP